MQFQGNFTNEVNYSLWEDDGVILESPLNKKSSTGILNGILLLIFTVIGVALNGFIILAIVPNRKLRTVRNILLVHLGSLGLAESILNTLFSGVVSLVGHWIGGDITCHIYGFLQISLNVASVLTIAALSWDKYQTIASPLHHSLTATFRKMISLFSVFWAVAIVTAFPPLVGGIEYTFQPVMGTCFMNHINTAGRWYVGISISLMFYIPLIVMLYCYTHIFRIARTQSSRIAATMVRMACVVQAPVAPNSQTTLSIKGTKAMGTILQLVGAFTLTYIPFSIVIVIECICGSKIVNTVVLSVVSTLFQAAPMTNGAIYGLRNKILRNSFKRFIRRKVQRLCYKDKRRGSVKSLSRRPSSFRMSQRKTQQNGGVHEGLRRTQSLQVKHLGPPRPSIFKFESSDNIRRNVSFQIPNGHVSSSFEDVPNIKRKLEIPQIKISSPTDDSHNIHIFLESNESSDVGSDIKGEGQTRDN